MSSSLTRLLSALVLIPVVLAVVWLLPPVATMVLLSLVATVTAREFSLLVRSWPRALAVPVWLVYGLAPLILIGLIRADFGAGVLMILFGVIVASDSAQYYAGRAFGRRLLAPTISPKKTVAGAVGGLVASIAMAIALSRVWLPRASPIIVALMGASMGITGMAGDLFESWLKRRAGVKDSGNLIPGHGGMLDRIDSWLFAAPVFYAFLRLTL